MEQKLKQDIQLAKPSAPSVWSGELTQDQVVSKLQLMDLDITRSIYSQIEGGSLQHPHLGPSGLSRIFQVDYNTFFRDVHLPGSE